MPHGQLTHIDFPSDDLARAKRFYAELFGWDIGQRPDFPDYELFTSGPGDVGGGIGLRGESAPDVLRIYVTVDSIDDALAKVERLGGSVKVEKTDVPGMGSYAAVIDSEGSEIGLWEDLPA
jgi:predicted enzyme related to lactoylglutathione lyase